MSPLADISFGQGVAGGAAAGTVGLFWCLGVVWAAATFFAGLVLAYLVYQDASKRTRTAFGIPPWAWFVIVMTSSIVAALAYWIMHYSALALPDAGVAAAPGIRTGA